MNITDNTILVAGAGNIGGAMARGLAAAGYNILLWNRSPQRLENFRSLARITPTSSMSECLAKAPAMVLVCVEGEAVPSVLATMRAYTDLNRTIVVSCAAAPSLDKLENWLESANSPCLARVLPNIAATVGKSVNLIATRGLDGDQTELLDKVMAVTGTNFFIPEALFPAAMVISSCGIAYAMRYVRATTEGAVAHGISPDTASRLCAASMQGAASILLEGKAHPEQLVDSVTTPGGMTIRGLNAMEKAGFSAAVMASFDALKPL